MSTRWNPFIKQVVFIGTLAASIWLIFRLRILWTPLLLVFILSFLASLLVNAILRRTGWPRLLVVILVYLFLILSFGIVTANVIPWAMTLGNGLANTLRRVLIELARATPAPIEITPTLVLELGELYLPIQQALNSIINLDPAAIQRLQDFLFPFASSAAAVVIGAISSLLTTFFVLIVSFYLVKDWPRIVQFFLIRVPPHFRPEIRRLWAELAGVWDAFARGQMIASLVMGFNIWVTLTILGVRNAPALGLLAAAGEFVPAIGPVISAAAGTLIALTFRSVWLPLSNPWFALLVLGIYLVFGQIQNLLILPRVIGRRIDLHPIVIISGALIGAELMGILGILLAAPTIASIRVLFGYAFNKLLDQAPFLSAAEAGDPKAFWRELVARRPIQAILFDLDGTLIETDDEIERALADRLRFLEQVLPVTSRKRAARHLLLISEVWVNGCITLLDRLRLDGLLFRLNDTFHRWRGIRSQTRFVAVSGAPELLADLAARYPLGVVTSRKRAEAQAFLAQYKLTELFRVVITRDDTPRLKPHPMPVELAAARLGIPAAQCVLVGDTDVDVRAAKAAGALAVGVLCGFGERSDFTHADLVLDTTAQLAAWL